MCGITGFISLTKDYSINDLRFVLSGMAGSLYHRGPDDGGIWEDESAGVGLGHRRLSIIDLSPDGRQPMVSRCGRYVIIYNGEVYNYRELRRELEQKGHIFRGHSDTEVILAAIAEWGLNKAVRRFIGMFAFATWDRGEKILYLVRDRLGIKPLYYGTAGHVFLFASELKALKKYPAFRNDINRNALALYLRFNYIPAPYTIYRGIYKLPPGSILTFRLGNGVVEPEINRYWSAEEVAEAGVGRSLSCSDSEAVELLDDLLRKAVRARMVSDVPLGAFLSGGVDSSSVVALMQVQSDRPVKTFTIGFHESAYNEAEDAKAVARHLGTDHTEFYVSPQEAMDVIPLLPTLYDEPFSDSSQIPTYLVSKLARQHVTVCLSGDGGDELFGGYNRYFWGWSIWRKTGWMPGGLKKAAALGLTALSPRLWESLFHKLGPVLPEKNKQRNPGYKLHKLAEVLAAGSPEAMYYGLVSHWKNPTGVVIGSTEPPTVVTDRSRWADLQDFTQRMMYLDLVTYLPNDILTKVDRASMGVSLEARVPLLDHRVVEFAWRVPLSMKIRNGQSKWLLRQVLYKYVPKELIERPKMGFGIPIDDWLRGPLRDWAEDLLSEERLKREGYLRPEPIRKLWKEHLSGKRNWQYHLWDVLMFEAWLDNNKK
ncbi:MAG: asparagine synthase (glutamine-hydrolyzing) [Firmicutes bacterium]|nr:asparagine synthase (glutamine-hydrolyzing) [Bacillota bacterium]